MTAFSRVFAEYDGTRNGPFLSPLHERIGRLVTLRGLRDTRPISTLWTQSEGGVRGILESRARGSAGFAIGANLVGSRGRPVSKRKSSDRKSLSSAVRAHVI